MKIFYFGNPFIKQDNLAIRIAEKLMPLLPDVQFIYIKDTFQILERKKELENSIVLDVVKGINTPQLIPFEKIKSSNSLTSHDFDLAFILKLANPQIIKIIGIPQEYPEEKAVEEVKNIILNLA